MKVSKAVCTVGSGLGSIMMIGAGTGGLFGLGWLVVNYVNRGIGIFIATWIAIPALCVVLFVACAAGWWALSEWLYGHCQDYWSKK